MGHRIQRESGSVDLEKDVEVSHSTVSTLSVDPSSNKVPLHVLDVPFVRDTSATQTSRMEMACEAKSTNTASVHSFSFSNNEGNQLSTESVDAWDCVVAAIADGDDQETSYALRAIVDTLAVEVLEPDMYSDDDC